MKKFLAVLAGCTVFILLLFMFTIERSLSPEIVQTAADDTRKMLNVLKTNPADFEKAEMILSGPIKKVLGRIDEKDDEIFYDTISSAMEKGQEGSIPATMVTIARVTFIHAYSRALTLELETATGGKWEVDDSEKRARTYFDLLEPEIEKAQQYSKSETAIIKRISDLFNDFVSSAADPQKDHESIAREIKRNLKGVFMILTLKQLELLEQHQGKETESALPYHAAAKLYYRIYYEDHAIADRAKAVMTIGEFRDKPADIDVPMIRQYLFDAFNEYIPELSGKDIFGLKAEPEVSKKDVEENDLAAMPQA